MFDWLGRAAGAVLLFISMIFHLGSIVDVYAHYKSPISQVIIHVIVWSNYLPYGDECNNYSKEGWIAVISESKISVAIPDRLRGYTFEAKVCNKVA
jgi:hypothetical protein